ncbi:MAG: hydantoinase B/oxoprolinase family protein [Deinococcota bacterium]
MNNTNLDPITLEIQWQRLIAIMDEVDNAVIRTSFSTIVGESHDFACILLDADAASLCQSSFSPPDFCVILPRTSKVLLEKFPVDSLQEGDVLFTNDPWIAAGHLPDYAIITPIFWQGKVVAFMGTIAHVADVGGHSGDIIASDVYTEGVCVPPAKLYEAGQENKLLFDIIANNCRVPEMVLGDVRAIVGTHQVGAKRLKEFLRDYELESLKTLSATILSRSEAYLRDKIAALPDGHYEFGLDIDGYIDPVHLHATVEVRGSDIFVDYTGTSAQTRKAAINCVYNVTFSSTMYPFKCALAPTIPNNEALFRPIHVSAPEGCILNCTFPHPVNARAKTTNNINQVIFGAAWPILGEHAQAGSGSIWPFSVSGEASGYGRFSVHILPHGGRGAMRDLDGLLPIAFPHNSSVTPTEIMETRAPVLILNKELLPDSAGAGKSRGGLGQQMTFRNIGDQAMFARVRPDKVLFPPPGIHGGQVGRVGEVIFNGEVITEFPILDFKPNDEITLLMPGGAGFGDVRERNHQATLRDVQLGYLSAEAAQRDYGLDDL